MKSKVKEIEERLEKVNNIVYANTIVLGSEDYFKIRELCTEHLKN